MNDSDLRVIKTKRLLADTLIALLRSESFKEVTVQQLCDESLIGRSTFYRHYSDKYALLEEMVVRFADDFEKYINERMHEKDITGVMQQLAGHLETNRQAIICLLDVHEEHADLSAAFRTILHRQILKLIMDQRLNEHVHVPADYLAGLYVANAMTFITWTLIHGEDDRIVLMMNRMQSVLMIDK
ncbi:TetR/AcrR family transcriptional regulator [Sporolactobacillus sp. KGMB 08714]|uniref:TetR/AcrR family transcriptional regulator n=1 Tax=Sporolactobacillus sp. KGMB 08714 TaxID=3064704 RepID=UPI002FBE75D7